MNGIKKEPLQNAWKWWYQRNQSTGRRRSTGMGRLILQTLIAFGAAAFLAFKFHRVFLAGIAAGIGLFILLSALFMPRLHAAIERIIGAVAFAVGQALTWLLLAPFYFLCFGPARMMLILAKRDPMNRSWEPSLPSYWKKKSPLQDNNRLTRQY